MCQTCAPRRLTLDRGPSSPRSEWRRARNAERRYLRQLLTIARHIGDLTATGFDPADPASATRLEVMLRRYAETITPWAEAAGRSMVSEVAARDERQWFRASREMGRALRAEIASAPTGMAMQSALAEQVGLIRSLPLDAAQRVHDLTLRGITEGARASDIAAEIMRSGNVSAARANLIARTEVARTASVLTQARAEHIGSPGYFWRTSGDTDVRASHKAMAGKFVAWGDPPTLDDMTGHAGAFPNCFTGDTKVSLGNGLKALWRVPFKGDVVEISTGISSVSVTPNHPILTGRGWVPAGEIEDSDYLIQAIDDACIVVEKNEDGELPTFDEVHSALRMNVERRPGFGFDFYGDVPDGDVDVITVNQLLSHDGMAETFKGIRDLALSSADGGVRDPIVVRCGNKIPKSGFSCIGNERYPLLTAELVHSDVIRLAGRSSDDTRCLKSSTYCESGNTVSLGESELTGAVSVLVNNFGLRKVCNSVVAAGLTARDFDPSGPELLAEIVRMHSNDSRSIFQRGSRRYKALRVVDKCIRSFSGHVFTMETTNGWYSVTSAGIIAKNCRCYPEPVLPDD